MLFRPDVGGDPEREMSLITWKRLILIYI